MKKQILKILFIVACLLVGIGLSGSVRAAEGDLIWEKNIDSSGGENAALGTAVDSTGVYAVGYDYTASSGQRWRVEKRSLTDGNLIWSQVYNQSFYGVQTNEAAWDVAIDSSGVYVAGMDYASSGFEPRWRMEKRSLVDGSLIWVVYTRVSSMGYNDVARGISIDSSGIYVAGWDSAPGHSEFRIEKRTLNNGGLLWTRVTNPSGGYDAYYDVAVDSSGVYIGGGLNLTGAGYIEKRSLDDGNLIWNKSDVVGAITGVSADSTGVYAVNNSGYVEKRSAINGELIWSVSSSPSGGWYDYFSIINDLSGVYVARSDGAGWGNPSTNWHVEKRSLVSGDLIWSKVGDTPNYSGASDVAVDSDGVYVIGHDSYIVHSFYDRESRWRIEKRSIAPALQPSLTLTPNPVETNRIFSANISASTGNITQVRFLLDDTNSVTAPLATDLRWSATPYDWAVNSTSWDSATKILSNQAFATAGNKKVWIEIKDALNNTSYAFADLTVNDPPIPPTVQSKTCGSCTAIKSNCGPGTRDCVFIFTDSSTLNIHEDCDTGVTCRDLNWREVSPN